MSALKVTQTEDILLDFCSLMPLRKTGKLVKVGGQRYILGTLIRKGKNRKNQRCVYKFRHKEKETGI